MLFIHTPRNGLSAYTGTTHGIKASMSIVDNSRVNVLFITIVLRNKLLPTLLHRAQELYKRTAERECKSKYFLSNRVYAKAIKRLIRPELYNNVCSTDSMPYKR